MRVSRTREPFPSKGTAFRTATAPDDVYECVGSGGVWISLSSGSRYVVTR